MMSVEVPTIEQFTKVLLRLAQLEQRMADLEAQQPAWVKQDEACRLTGYSRKWFQRQRAAGKLPIAYRKDEGAPLLYDRADCVVQSRKNIIQPIVPTV